MISVLLPIRTESEANTRECWQSKHRRAKSQRGIVKMMLFSHRRKLPGDEGGTIILTRIAPRGLDGDNLQRSFKAIRDQVAEEIGIDDGDARLTWFYRQEKGKPKEYAVRVEVKNA